MLNLYLNYFYIILLLSSQNILNVIYVISVLFEMVLIKMREIIQSI